MPRPSTAWIFAVIVGLGAQPSPRGVDASDRIILRNLSTISDRTIVAFDDDGLLLDDQSRLGWDEVEAARLDESRQQEFDRLLAELGDPLYRIRQRLRVGDYRDVLPQAEALAPRYRPRSSATAYMVAQALMWGRLANGLREQALVPYLRCLTLLIAEPQWAQGLPGRRRLQFDPATGLADELPPVWFDSQAAQGELKTVFETIAAMPRPRPAGAYVYYATLAVAAGRPEQARRVLVALDSQGGVLAELRQIVMVQMELAEAESSGALERLSQQWPGYSTMTRPLALYWLGRGRLQDEDPLARRRALLLLLRIPALEGEQQPVLSAAALYDSMQALQELGDAAGSRAVRAELLLQYGQTWHAAQVRREQVEKE